MSNKYLFAAVASLVLAQPLFADETMNFNDKPCAAIAKACGDAGFSRDGEAGKQFWGDCMKPVIMGKSVKNITVSKDDVKACRTDKISELRQELKQFEGVR